MPKISFLLLIYNGETFLSETMDSLLAQTHEDFERIGCWWTRSGVLFKAGDIECSAP